MNAQIERDFDFQAAVYFQNTFLINLYSFTINIEVNTESIHEQNVAMDRLKYLMYEVFENAVFIDENEQDVIKLYKAAGLKICTLPEEPYDQIIALLLMLKFESVCEGRLKMLNINFTSKLSDQVRFKEDILTAQHTYGDSGWWIEPTPSIECTKQKRQGKEKVVKLKNNEWNETGLVWKEKREKSTEIVFNIDTEK